MLANKLLGAAAAAVPQYIEDVFSTYLYTGNGSTQTITNGINLSGKGGMVWIGRRNTTNFNVVTDTARGANNQLNTYLTDAQSSVSANWTFNSDGFSQNNSFNGYNASSSSYCAWTFRKQAKFFDVVTYTGNGSNRTISHSLGSVPGCIIIKRTDTAADWQVYHRSLANTEYLVLNSTAAKDTGTTRWNSTTPTSTEFSLGTDSTVNANSGTYVAYLFAHDAGGFGSSGNDNVISCGSFTTDGTSVPEVNLGYEPQWVLIKSSVGTSGNWVISDNMRGLPVGNNSARLLGNTSGAETTDYSMLDLTATGFKAPSGGSNPYAYNSTYIYIAIRRGPMKTPTSGTSVFDPEAYTGNSTSGRVITTSNLPDLTITKARDSGLFWPVWFDRLRGGGQISSNNTDAELAQGSNVAGYVSAYGNLGYTLTSGSSSISSLNGSQNYIGYAFSRAPGFFDEVCYTGTGSNTTITHNLGVAPELIIVKCRSNSGTAWQIYSQAVGISWFLQFDADAASNFSNATMLWNGTSPTSSVFSLGTDGDVNGSGRTYVAYLFASLSGVSKLGSYTGNGSNQTINCGFTAGARFVMIKRTDSTGDWFVYDSARGIVSGNDPQLKLNTTDAEATGYDAIDPDNSGFIVNNNATNFPINVNTATYIYLAIA
jgi:hypothetical protein